ncbi:helix-turn-helix transcriptional regulator [Pseudogemmobacter sonorensis]|uniref:helix-turn-helix transcriptional regulator n=1 Tax=Pseudogemmobacter sonorensis TaxID=2989681 RepID=UPI00368BF7C5
MSIPAPIPAHLITAATVRALCGGVADMTLWRWLNDPRMSFPRPVYIGKRRYFRRDEVIRWLENLRPEATEHGANCAR